MPVINITFYCSIVEDLFLFCSIRCALSFCEYSSVVYKEFIIFPSFASAWWFLFDFFYDEEFSSLDFYHIVTLFDLESKAFAYKIIRDDSIADDLTKLIFRSYNDAYDELAAFYEDLAALTKELNIQYKRLI